MAVLYLQVISADLGVDRGRVVRADGGGSAGKRQFARLADIAQPAIENALGLHADTACDLRRYGAKRLDGNAGRAEFGGMPDIPLDDPAILRHRSGAVQRRYLKIAHETSAGRKARACLYASVTAPWCLR